MRFHYFDSSALIKLLVEEGESPALEAWIAEHGGMRTVITSDLAHTEVRRALHRAGDELTLTAAERMLDKLVQIMLDADLFIDAGELAPQSNVRSLDAIHTVAALQLGSAVVTFVTYDKRQAECAAHAGLNVVSPA